MPLEDTFKSKAETKPKTAIDVLDSLKTSGMRANYKPILAAKIMPKYGGKYAQEADCPCDPVCDCLGL